jgi:hypothetical protein
MPVTYLARPLIDRNHAVAELRFINTLKLGQADSTLCSICMTGAEFMFQAIQG